MEIKMRCAPCQGWRHTVIEEAVTIVNATAMCSWHAKEFYSQRDLFPATVPAADTAKPSPEGRKLR